jgi:hypothetical protein
VTDALFSGSRSTIYARDFYRPLFWFICNIPGGAPAAIARIWYFRRAELARVEEAIARNCERSGDTESDIAAILIMRRISSSDSLNKANKGYARAKGTIIPLLTPLFVHNENCCRDAIRVYKRTAWD